MNERKRLLLVGAGRWGQILEKNLSGHPRAFVAGTVSSQPGISGPVFTNLEAALREKWDGILLATPPTIHGQQLHRCLELGIPTFVEKPLCLSEQEAESLFDLQQKSGTPVLVDHIHLFSAGYEYIKGKIKPSDPMLHIESEGGNWGPFRKDYSSLWDYGAHDMSVILDLLQAEPITASVQTHAKFLEDDGHAGDYSVNLKFTGEKSARFRVANTRKEKARYYRIETNQKIFTLHDVPTHSVTVECKKSGERETIVLPQIKPLENVLNVYCDGLAGRFDSRWGLALGVKVVRWLSYCDELTQKI